MRKRGGSTLQTPFPYFGGKSTIAPLVWERFGIVQNYVTPFCGSLADLLANPNPDCTETANDLDGFVINFWRAICADPEAVARWCDWPVSEADLHPRHWWLVSRREELTEKLMGDPDFYDAKIAGWWVWGICCWIGSGWCSGEGPWQCVDGRLAKGDDGGINRQRPHLGDAGMGINKQLPHLGDAGMGINKKRPHLGDAGRGEGLSAQGQSVLDWFEALKVRLRRVRFSCGDFSRVLGPSVTTKHGLTAVFLDPPYDKGIRESGLYSVDTDPATAARDWAIENGGNPLLRIALCGYEGEHCDLMPEGWTIERWKARGGFGSQGQGRGRENAKKEVIWFSPHCLGKKQGQLFGHHGRGQAAVP